ncbi:MAG: hypothetical protein ABH830_00040, partial [Patescibacteria group bacterium]
MLEKDKIKELKKLIPLRRISQEGPYNTAYLSLLVQRKKLKAKRIGRNFFTTREWFNDYLDNHARDEKRQGKKLAYIEDIKTDKITAKLEGQQKPDVKNVIISKGLVSKPSEEKVVLKEDKTLEVNLIKPKEHEIENIEDKKLFFDEKIIKATPVEKESSNWQNELISQREKIKTELKDQNVQIKKYKKSLQQLVIKKYLVSFYKNSLNSFSLGLKNLDYLLILIPKFLINKPREFFSKTFSFKKLSYRYLTVTSLIILLSFVSLIFLIIPASSTYIKFVEYKKLILPDPRLEQISKLIDNQFLNLSDEFIRLEQNEKIILSDKEAFYLKIASLTGRLITSSRAVEENFKNNLAIFKNKISFNNFTLNFLASQFDSLKIIKEKILAKVFNYGENKVVAVRKGLESKKQIADSGQVAGVSEALEPEVLPFEEDRMTNKLLALVDKATSQSQQAIKAAKDASLKTVEKIAEEQESLSYSLGDKLAKLSLSGAEKIKGITKTGSKKLAQVSETIKETTEESKNISDNSKVVLKEELDRSVWSVSDLYVKVLDFLIPDSLKKHYVEIYKTEEQIAGQCLPEDEGTQIIKETIKIVTEKPSSQPAVSQPAGISAPVLKESIIRKDKLIVLGNSELVGNLFVGGNARFDQQATVIGGLDAIGGIFNSQGNVIIYDNLDVKEILTANNLRVIGWSEFLGPANLTSLSADDVLIRNDLVVYNDELIYGNLTVGGTMSAGYLELGSLGVSGLVSAQGLSVGDYGFTASGDAYFQGDKTYLNSKHTYVTGVLSISKNLDLDVSDTQALAVGDGSTNTFIVNTADDIVTIAGNLIVTGSQIYSGDMAINGTLSITASSSSAVLAVTQSGSGDIINFSNSSSQVFTIDNNGNLGLGTTSPAANLAIAGEAGSTDPLFLISTSTIDFATSTAFIINADGNVGIGTSSPLANLDIFGNLLLSGPDRYINFEYFTGSDGYGLRDNSGTLQFKNDGGGWTNFGSGAGYWTQVGSDIYYSTGLVGVGTSSPYSKLTLWGSNNLLELVSDASSTVFKVTDTGSTTIGSTIISPASSAWGDILVSNGSGAYWQATSTLGITGGGSGSGTVNSGVGGYLAFYPSTDTVVDDTDALYFDNDSDRLGIGTTSPYSQLTLWGTGQLLELSNDASSTVFRITDTGSTTIGSTIISPNASSLGDMLVSNGTNAYWQGTTTLGLASAGIYEDLSLNYLPKWNTTEFANSLIYDNGTNVGIGTTSPYAKLSVAGAVVMDYFIATSTTASSTAANGIDISGGCFAIDGV